MVDPAPYPPGTQVRRDIPYVPHGHERQKLDLYRPPSTQKKPLPLIVWIHGGGWESGSRADNGAQAALSHGYAVASLGYRLSQTAPFPAQLDDCKAAIRYLRANAAALGFDPKRIGVWGASAGGHLAALVGVNGGGVQAVCDYFGPTDMMLYRASRPGDTLSKLIGGPIQANIEKVHKADPVTYVRRGAPPFLICHGDQDPIVPLEHSRRLEAALRRAGVPVILKIVPGEGHGFRHTDVNPEVLAFFDRWLKGKKG